MPEESKSSLATQSRLKARSLLFTLYGDFAVEGERTGAIRIGPVVQVASDLGVTEMAIRSAASRMVQEGWLVSERHGRESIYTLTERGWEAVLERHRRVFTLPDAWWNGSWFVIALSVPESKRDIRDRMRKELSWLGFGSPSSALYVSARDYSQEVLSLANELGAVEYMQVYRSEALWPQEPRDLVRRAWGDLTPINQRYSWFLETYAPILARTRVRMREGAFTEREAFVLRFSLANEYRRCLFGDPDLPLDLLPASWNGVAARLLLREFYTLVSPEALRYFDNVVAAGLAERQESAAPAATNVSDETAA